MVLPSWSNEPADDQGTMDDDSRHSSLDRLSNSRPCSNQSAAYPSYCHIIGYPPYLASCIRTRTWADAPAPKRPPDHHPSHHPVPRADLVQRNHQAHIRELRLVHLSSNVAFSPGALEKLLERLAELSRH
ncbi:hypothetical protein BC938DRAFT_480970 [Jimgerdemannia flammicorona]|uniref:Uncharacterized protein n=1 Tax=Jimgerdemannia flammicorona TaxID=994334 RepID=A0A433QHC9_9FUNG|nr:hypothetical protein BC938DRAFT_480970 [Jimgerdemannia flammicorona]